MDLVVAQRVLTSQHTILSGRDAREREGSARSEAVDIPGQPVCTRAHQLSRDHGVANGRAAEHVKDIGHHAAYR